MELLEKEIELLIDKLERQEIAIKVFFEHIPDSEKIKALADAAYNIRLEIVEQIKTTLFEN